jgi:hypothetical protein
MHIDGVIETSEIREACMRGVEWMGNELSEYGNVKFAHGKLLE